MAEIQKGNVSHDKKLYTMDSNGRLVSDLQAKAYYGNKGSYQIGGNIKNLVLVVVLLMFFTYVFTGFVQGNQITVNVNGESRVVERPESLKKVGIMQILLLCSQNPAAVRPETFKSIQSYFNTKLELAPNATGCQVAGAEFFRGFNKTLGTVVVFILSLYNVLTYAVSFVSLVVTY